MRSLLGLVVLLLVGCNGCSWLQSPQGSATVTTAVDTIVCVLNHETEPPQQIANECAVGTVEDVIKILDAHHAAEIREAALPTEAGTVTRTLSHP